MKFVKLANFRIWEDFRVLYYIKSRISLILHTLVYWKILMFFNYIKVAKFIKLAKVGLLEDFRLLYYIKVTKFVKLANFRILEDFRVLYYIKSRSLLNLQIL